MRVIYEVVDALQGFMNQLHGTVTVLSNVMRTHISLHIDRIVFTVQTSIRIVEPRRQAPKLNEINEAKTRPSSRDYHERIRGRQIRPGGRKAHRAPFSVVEINPVLTPRLAILQNLELLTTKWVKGMCHPKTLPRSVAIGCN